MIELLSRIFIKNRRNVSDPSVRRAYGKLCGVFGIILNILLFGGKFFAGVVSGSVAIRADAFNNLSDAASSVITLLGFVLAGKKPDPDHPFGHGRAEYLTGLLLSVVIIHTGLDLFTASVQKIIDPEPVQAGLLPAVILLIGIVVKVYMYCYNRSIGRKIGSETMQAAAADSLSDSVATLVVLLSMGISYFFHVNIDGWAGLVVAGFILFSGFGAAKETVSPLLGRAPDRELVENIQKTVLEEPEIVGIHDIIVHDYGPGRLMVSLHAEVNGNGDIFELHDAIDRAEIILRAQYGCLATIHMDPIEADNTEISRLRSEVHNKLTELEPSITIHDFRMVPGPTHTNLIFDAVLPADCPVSDEEMAKNIRSLVNSTWPDRYAVVTIDRSYI